MFASGVSAWDVMGGFMSGQDGLSFLPPALAFSSRDTYHDGAHALLDELLLHLPHQHRADAAPVRVRYCGLFNRI